MLKRWTTGALIACAGFGCQHRGDPGLDVGADNRGAPPFFAGIRVEGGDSTFCGGSFISPRLVLTAAHCVELNNQRIEVIHGVSQVSDMAKQAAVRAQAVVIHPKYDPVKWDNDIALIYLESYKPSQWPTLKPIALNTDNFQPEADHSLALEVVGFGNASSYGDLYRSELMAARLVALNPAECKAASAFYTTRITDRQICAESPEPLTMDACYGDSGGPLFQTTAQGARLLGLVSWGDGCAMKGRPGVYTRVSAYRAWIESESQRLQKAAADQTPATLGGLFAENCYYASDERTIDTEGVSFAVNSWLQLGGTFQVGARSSGAAVDTCPVRDGAGTTGQARIVRTEAGKYIANFAWQGQSYETTLTPVMDSYVTCREAVFENFFHLVRRPQSVTGNVIFRNRDYDLEPMTGTIPGSPIYSCGAGSDQITVMQAADGGLFLQLNGPSFGGTATAALTAFAIPFPELQLRAATAHTRVGELVLRNASDRPLLSWEISCPFNYSLTSMDGRLWLPDPRTGTNTLQFMQQKTSWGVVEGGKAVSFQIALKDQTLDSVQSMFCKVNGRNLSLPFSTIEEAAKNR